jgi:hypothetical protein
MNVNELLNVIEAALPSVTWKKQEPPGPDNTLSGFDPIDHRSFDARFGRSESGWMFTVIACDVELGDPTSRVYDGAAVKKGVVVHLTPELAEKAFRYASVVDT